MSPEPAPSVRLAVSPSPRLPVSPDGEHLPPRLFLQPQRREPRQQHHARRREKRRARARGVVRPADRLGTQGPSERAQRLRRAERRPLLGGRRSEEHTSELQSPCNLVCRLLLEKKK